MIRAILFDLGNVLVPVDFARCHQALAGVCAHPPEDVPRIMRQSGLAQQYEQGLIDTAEFRQRSCELLGMSVAEEQFGDIWVSIFLPQPLVSEDLVEYLSQRYRVLLLSNTNALHFEFARQRYPLLRHFHGYVLSYEVRALKPSPAIYKEAIARAGCRPEECFFTDDVPENVAGAVAAGIDAVQFLSSEQLDAELRARRVID